MKSGFGIALIALMMGDSAQVENSHTSISPIVEIMTGPVCQTQEDVQRYIALYDGAVQTTIAALNAETDDPHSCIMATVEYLRGPQNGTGWNHDTAFEIYRILVVGVDMQAGMRLAHPAPYFTAFGVREFAI
jgi:hypothetical protein